MPQVGADEPPENGPYVEYYENGQKESETHYKDGRKEGLETVSGQLSYSPRLNISPHPLQNVPLIYALSISNEGDSPEA